MSGRLADVKVLLVDDDSDVLEAMDTAMKSEGAQTRTVADGNDAVSACQEFAPALVVLDMMLPKRSGFLVLEKIKGYDNCPAVIMLTANEGKRHQAYAESLGVDRYLLKPVPLEKLLSASEELVAARSGKPKAVVPTRAASAAASAAEDTSDTETADKPRRRAKKA